MSKKKHSVIKLKPEVGKKPKLTPMFEREDDTVIFSFLWFDDNNKWCTNTKENVHDFWDISGKLKSFEQRRWKEIAANQKRDHSIPLENLIPEAQKIAVEKMIDDYDEIWSFHLTGQQRLWGVKYDRRFMAIWWDPEHLICPTQKD